MNRSRETINQYLLGELSEAEATTLEQEYFSEPQFFDQVVEAENELVDQYARGQLSPRMRDRFITYYLAHPPRRHRAEFAAALTVRLDQKREVTVTPTPTEWWSRWLAFMSGSRLALGFTMALLLLIAGVIWFAIRTRERTLQDQRGSQPQLAAEGPRQDQVASQLDHQQEEPKVAQPVPPTPTPQAQKAAAVATLLLNITGVRGAATGSPPTLALAPGTEKARIELNLSDNDYAKYSVVIQTADGKQVFERDGLQSGNRARSHLSVVVPANKLSSGDYILTLKGTTQSGEVEEISKSLFRVSQNRATMNR